MPTAEWRVGNRDDRSGTTRANDLVDADCAHEEDDEGKQAKKAPGPAHVLFDDGQHDYGDQKDGRHFVPDPKLLR